MDTSQDYIDMCIKAEEIRKLKIKLEKGDVYSEPICTVFEVKPNFGNVRKSKLKSIWLPCQDQLQEMTEDSKDWSGPCRIVNLIQIMWRRAKDLIWENSFEKLWLSIVMKEKYNKVWDKGNWVNEKKRQRKVR